jgi:hypothetical protein
MSFEEKFHDAIEELKRADHSISVSLKYTRTVDVIKSIIERLTNTIEFAFDAILEKSKEKEKITEIPKLPRQKTEKVLELYPDDTIQDYVEFYFSLRKILKSNFQSSKEFRRHVTMTANLDDKKIEVTIDIITDYFNRVKEMLNYILQLINPEQSQ